MRLVTTAAMAALLLDCGASAPPASSDSSEEVPPTPQEQAAVVGGQCEGPPFTQSSCADGLLCGPGPGGYCTTFCASDDDCPGEATCTSTARVNRLCMSHCESNGDCRAEEGYICDAAWGSCFLPGFHIPRIAACEGELPARGAWSAPTIVSTGEAARRFSIEPAASMGPDGSLVVA